ncbi:MAG: GumC family protein [Microcystaceae cyanobacterium]
MTASYSELPSSEVASPETKPKKANAIRPLIRLVLRRSWLVILLASLAAIASYARTLDKPSTYKGNFYLLVEPISATAKLTDPSTLTRTDPSTGVPKGDLFALDYPTNLAFLQSPGMTFRIAQEVHRRLPKRSVPEIWKDLRSNFTVEWIRAKSGRDATKIFEVSYEGTDAKEVETVLQIAADTFVKYSAEDRETSIKAGVKFINSQLPNLQKNLNAQKVKLQRIREQYSLVDPESRSEALLTEISTLTNQRLLVNQQLMAQVALQKSLEKQLQSTPEEAIAAAILNQDQERVNLIKRIQDLEAQIAQIRATVTDNNPQYLTLQEQRENLQVLLEQRTKTLLKSTSPLAASKALNFDFQDPTRLKLLNQLIDTNNQVQSLQAQLPIIDQKLSQVRALATAMPNLINQYNAINRDIKLTEDVVNKLLLQWETLKVEAAQELPWQLISKPQIPLDAKGNPLGAPPDRQKSVLVGVVGGAVLSLVIIILWDKRSNKFLCAADIQDLLAVSLIGVIPKSLDLKNTPLFKVSSLSKETPSASSPFPTVQTLEEPLTLELSPSVPREAPSSTLQLFTEDFHVIYTELSFFYRHPPLRSLVISGIQAGDGQTTMLLNLAIAATHSKKRVLVVDANYLNPHLHTLFNLPNEKGLRNYLEEELPLNHLIQPVPSHKNLYLLSLGQGQETGSLWSDGFHYLIAELQANYDFVFYHLPPFPDSSDIYFISTYTDGLILVVSVNQTSRSLAKEVIKRTQEFQLPVLGAIANFA